MVSKIIKKHFFSVLLLLAFFNTEGHSEEASISMAGEGQFLSRPTDNWEFVKKQLYSSAIEDVYSKTLKEMNLDSDLFWKKFNSRFENTFHPTEEELKAKFGLTGEKNPEKHPKFAQYESEMREARLNLRAKFGNLMKSIVAYSEKRQSRSPTSPNMRFLTLGTKVDRQTINNIYYKFVSEGKNRDFTKIYLSVDFNLKGMEWKDVGVDLASDFTKVVEEHWKKWLGENLKDQIKEVSTLSPAHVEDMKDYLKKEGSFNGRPGPQDISQKVPDDYRNGLWLKVQVRFVGMDKRDNGETGLPMKIEGEYLLLDLTTKDVLSSLDFPHAEHFFTTADPQVLSSNVASTLYRIPLESWAALSKSMNNLPEVSGHIFLEVQKVNSIAHIYDFLEFLSQKGAAHSLHGNLDSYDGKEARVSVRYQGETEKVVALLKSFQHAEIGKDVSLNIDDLDKPFVLSLKPKINNEIHQKQN